MAEYITKESAIEVFEWGDADVIEEYGDGCNFGFSRGLIKSTINAIPAADVAPVAHGRWIATHDEFCSCSLCKYPVHAAWSQTNYCPNCGAKMNEKEE